MTVTLRNNKPLVVPDAVRRKAGLRSGDRIEFQVSGRVINIIPKLVGCRRNNFSIEIPCVRMSANAANTSVRATHVAHIPRVIQASRSGRAF